MKNIIKEHFEMVKAKELFNEATENKIYLEKVKKVIHQKNLQRQVNIEKDISVRWNKWIAKEVGFVWIGLEELE